MVWRRKVIPKHNKKCFSIDVITFLNNIKISQLGPSRYLALVVKSPRPLTKRAYIHKTSRVI